MDINRICPECLREQPGGQNTGTCCYCGYQNRIGEEKQPYHHLKRSSILAGKYLVGRVLGEGGFGITYIGLDLNYGYRVAIKEFYPNGYVTRDGASTCRVTDYEGSNYQTVQKWKKSFIKEAQALARCTDLPGVVGVKEFFQENNTAYIILEYLEGETLKEYLKRCGGRISVEDTLRFMKPVMISLQQVHEQGLIHRDISPDNLMVLSGDNVKLLDFGAAREYEVGDEKSLSVMLKPGYAPEEQYRTKGRQGPWSDVYALCSSIYKCITGVTPPEAMERMRQDDLAAPSQMGICISKKVETTLLKGMAVYAEQRIQSMRELYESFYSVEEEISKIGTVTEGAENTGSVENTENVENVRTSDNEKNPEVAEAALEAKTKETVSEVHTKKMVISGKTLAISIAVIGILIGMLVIGTRFLHRDQKAEQQYARQSEQVMQTTLSGEEAEEAYTFYGDLIVHMVEDNSLPYIDDEPFDPERFQSGDFPDIYAAIQDVDRDGMKELVLRIEEADETGKQNRQVVYQYDISRHDVVVEMNVNAVGEFYSNGIFIATGASTEETVMMSYNATTGRYEKKAIDSDDEDLLRQRMENSEWMQIDYSKVAVH